jgi:hypothetical protein
VTGLLFLALTAASPDCTISPGFVQQGKPHEYDVETLYDYINGNSEGYFLYGFRRMRGLNCAKGGLKMVIDVSEFSSAELAYGMFTGNSDPRLPREAIGAVGQVTPTKATFAKGVYYGEVSIEPQGEHTSILREAAKALAARLEGSTGAPPQLAWFAKEGLQPGWPRLIPQSLLGLRMLTRGYLGQYEDGRAFVVTESSVEAARSLFTKLKERLAPAGAASAGEESYTGEDRFMGRFCFFRKGVHVGGYVNAKAADPARHARLLADRLP